MIDVVSLKFKGQSKIYYFDPAGTEVKPGQQVVVETSKGLELCECVQGNHTVTDERIVPPLRPVVRIATEDDLRIAELCKVREKEAFGICEKKIADHGLEMKLVDVECAFDGSKILFFFTAENRVDFRALVKDLAGVFRTRIELRQIGVRDEAARLGGIGICGQPFCCSRFLDEFHPVSTKMAKVQALSLNPTKISGCCGRLMCCLRYEQQAYEELVKQVPKVGTFVETPEGYGSVAAVNLIRQQLKVRLDGSDDAPGGFAAADVAVVPGGRPKNGETPPHVLQPQKKPKAPEAAEAKDDDWTAPPIFAEDTAVEAAPPRRTPAPDGAEPSAPRRHRSRGGKARSARPPRQEQEPLTGKPEKMAPSAGKPRKKNNSRRRSNRPKETKE